MEKFENMYGVDKGEHEGSSFGVFGMTVTVYDMEFKVQKEPNKGKKIRRLVEGVERGGRELVRFTSTFEDAKKWYEHMILKENTREMTEQEIIDWLKTTFWAEKIKIKERKQMAIADRPPKEPPVTPEPVVTPTPEPVVTTPTPIPTPTPEPGTGCFIATASYGTPFAKEIDILRAFRDNSLEPKPIGKMFVETYYKLSPPIANLISKSEKLRAVTRFMLNPIVKAFKR